MACCGWSIQNTLLLRRFFFGHFTVGRPDYSIPTGQIGSGKKRSMIGIEHRRIAFDDICNFRVFLELML